MLTLAIPMAGQTGAVRACIPRALLRMPLRGMGKSLQADACSLSR
jgi:hypothetical protein